MNSQDGGLRGISKASVTSRVIRGSGQRRGRAARSVQVQCKDQLGRGPSQLEGPQPAQPRQAESREDEMRAEARRHMISERGTSCEIEWSGRCRGRVVCSVQVQCKWMGPDTTSMTKCVAISLDPGIHEKVHTHTPSDYRPRHTQMRGILLFAPGREFVCKSPPAGEARGGGNVPLVLPPLPELTPDRPQASVGPTGLLRLFEVRPSHAACNNARDSVRPD